MKDGKRLLIGFVSLFLATITCGYLVYHKVSNYQSIIWIIFSIGCIVFLYLMSKMKGNE